MAFTARDKHINSLFYIKDSNTGLLFLVDTGVQISTVPPKNKMPAKSTLYKLQAGGIFIKFGLTKKSYLEVHDRTGQGTYIRH